MLRSEIFCLVVIFFVLVNTDLSEAKGRGGGRGGGRSGGRGGSRGWYGGSYGGGGDEINGAEFLLRARCCSVCDVMNDDEDNSYENSNENNIVMERNRQHLQNDCSSTAIDVQPTIHQSSNQFQDNLPQNTYHSTKTSPTHLPYSIVPDAPPPYPGDQNGKWINGSWVINV